jgi:hypothetical protein
MNPPDGIEGPGLSDMALAWRDLPERPISGRGNGNYAAAFAPTGMAPAAWRTRRGWASTILAPA